MDKFFIDNAANSIIFLCNRHYIDYLIKEMDINSSLGNLTYSLTNIPKENMCEHPIVYL